MNVKAFLQIAVSAMLFAIAIVVFTYSAYLAGSVATGGPRLLLFAGAIVAGALLVAYSPLSIPLIRWRMQRNSHPSVAGVASLPTQFERTEVTPLLNRPALQADLLAQCLPVFPRPNVGSAVESRTCHRCGREVVLQITSANLARRDALKLAASVGVLLFGGWAVCFALFSSATGYEQEGLMLPAFIPAFWSRLLARVPTSVFGRPACSIILTDHRRPLVVLTPMEKRSQIRLSGPANDPSRSTSAGCRRLSSLRAIERTSAPVCRCLALVALRVAVDGISSFIDDKRARMGHRWPDCHKRRTACSLNTSRLI